jgi:hypothetical protein
MIEAVPDCLVRDYNSLIAGLVLPDPDDRHVLAAAIHCRADTILTSNVRHFPADLLVEYDIAATNPDEFLMDLLELSPAIVLRVLDEQAEALNAPPMSVDQVLGRLAESGVPRLVVEVRRLRSA